MKLEITSKIKVLQRVTTGEWTVRQWHDGAGKATSSYEIWEGHADSRDTAKIVVADLLKDECEQICNAHNAALAAEQGKQPKFGNMAWQEVQQLRDQLAAAVELVNLLKNEYWAQTPLDVAKLADAFLAKIGDKP